MAQLSKECGDWLEGRGIDIETAIRCGLRTSEDRDWDKCSHQFKGWYRNEILVTENFRGGKVVGRKFRNTFEKDFTQQKGSQNLLFTGNTEVMEHEANFNQTLIICEGEMDWLSLQMAGFPICASAPSSSTMKPDADTGLYPMPKWMQAEEEALMSFQNIIIAVDDDETGNKLKQAMIDNLDRFSLYEVRFPDGCKDANDVLMNHGVRALEQLIHDAKPIPVSGVRTLKEVLNDKDPEFVKTGWTDLDKMVRLTAGLTVLTGYSGLGKSQFLRQLTAALLCRKGWSGMCAFFEDTPRYVGEDIVRQVMNFKVDMSRLEAIDLVNDRLTLIDARQARNGGRQTTTDWLMDVMQAKNLKDGAKFMILDPWSRISRTTNMRTNQTEQINQELQRLQDFAVEYGIFLIVAAHPRKPSGNFNQPPTEYDIADSRSFNDNADNVWIWHRPQKSGYTAYLRSAKVRNQHKGGKLGWMSFEFDPDTRHFVDGEVLNHRPDFGPSGNTN